MILFRGGRSAGELSLSSRHFAALSNPYLEFEMFRSILCAAVLAASSATAFAQVSLEPRLNENTKLRTTIEVSTDQTLTLAGMPLETKVEQFIVTKDEIGAKQADGKVLMTGKMETFQVEMTIPGGIAVNFDSGNPKTEAAIPELTPILQMFDAISSATYETTFSAPGKIDSITMKGDKYDALPAALRNEFSADRLKQEALQSLARLPADPVVKGDTWQRTETMNLGSGQTFEIERTFKYLGTANEGGRELDRISTTSNSVTLNIDPNPSLPLELKSSDLKITKSSGEFLFDRKLGSIVQTSDSLTVEGKLTLVAKGNELPGELKLTISSKSSRE